MKDMVGKTVEYRDGDKSMSCEVLAVKAGPMLLEMGSKIGSPKFRSSFKAKLRPVDGGKPFWTEAIAG